jgi:hypothetical protein
MFERAETRDDVNLNAQQTRERTRSLSCVVLLFWYGGILVSYVVSDLRKIARKWITQTNPSVLRIGQTKF